MLILRKRHFIVRDTFICSNGYDKNLLVYFKNYILAFSSHSTKYILKSHKIHFILPLICFDYHL